MKTIKNQLFHVYSLTRFIDDSNSLNIPFSFYRIGADILETIISSSPPFSFLTDYAKWQAIAQPKERSAKPLFPPGSLMEPRFFSPFHVETLPRDCRSVLLSAFRLSEHNDLVFRGFSPTDHSPLSFSSRDLRPASLEKGQETLRLRVYACYAWGGPLLVAGLAALLDHLPPQPQYTFLRPRFGVKQCWFYGKFIFLSSFNNKNNNNSCGEDLSNFLLCRRRRFPLCETL